MHRRIAAAAVSTLALAAGALTAGTPDAHADDPATPTVDVLASGLVLPLSVAVADDGTRYVTEDATGTLYQQPAGTTDGSLVPLYHNPKGGEVGGVSTDDGLLRFTEAGPKGKNYHGAVYTLSPRGGARKIAGTGAYEKAHNPDGDQTYGFRGLKQACAAQLPSFIGPEKYQGIVETHPYNTDVVDGVTYLADAGGNDILRVGPDGAVSTVAALRPRTVTFTAEAAESNGLPDCVIGKRYRFEPVPTDVEMGPDGYLYVSTLSGGPEDGSLGATGQVLRIDPATGDTTRVAQGLLSATGLGIAPDGDIYVSELFANQIVKIPEGRSHAVPYLSVPLPADVDVAADGLLYAVVNVLPGPDGPPDGQLVRITG